MSQPPIPRSTPQRNRSDEFESLLERARQPQPRYDIPRFEVPDIQELIANQRPALEQKLGPRAGVGTVDPGTLIDPSIERVIQPYLIYPSTRPETFNETTTEFDRRYWVSDPWRIRNLELFRRRLDDALGRVSPNVLPLIVLDSPDELHEWRRNEADRVLFERVGIPFGGGPGEPFKVVMIRGLGGLAGAAPWDDIAFLGDVFIEALSDYPSPNAATQPWLPISDASRTAAGQQGTGIHETLHLFGYEHTDASRASQPQDLRTAMGRPGFVPQIPEGPAALIPTDIDEQQLLNALPSPTAFSQSDLRAMAEQALGETPPDIMSILRRSANNDPSIGEGGFDNFARHEVLERELLARGIPARTVHNLSNSVFPGGKDLQTQALLDTPKIPGRLPTPPQLQPSADQAFQDLLMRVGQNGGMPTPTPQRVALPQ
jgi:hypothetical protein